MDTIRIGRISSLNYPAGTARVTYSDRDEAVTAEIPMLSLEYRMPNVGDLVLVLHLPNGSTAGLLLGRYWNDTNVPPESGKGLWRKDVSDTQRCFFKWDEQAGKLTVRIDGDAEIMCSGTLTVTGSTGDVVVAGKSLTTHTHTGVHGETSGPN